MNATTINKTDLFNRLNELRAAMGKPSLAAWKSSLTKLIETVAALEKATAKDEPTATTTAPETPERIGPEKLSATLLVYDIPSSNEKYADPGKTLRRIGFRVNLSCWVIPDGAIPHTFIKELREDWNANVELVRFDMAEGPRLVRMALDRMKKDVEEKMARSAEGIAFMDKHLNLAPELAANTEAREAAVKLYESRCKRIIKNLEELADDVEVAIKNFSVAPEALGLDDTRKAFAALSAGYAQKVNAYTRATEILKGRAEAAGDTNAAALANAAAKDLVPVEPLADALIENGAETEAKELMDAFAPPATDDGTFSLVDANDAA